MTWLLTGGAGYIGAHIVRALRSSGRRVVVLDDLSTGSADTVPDDVPLVEASILDGDRIATALREHAVTGVVHLAAKKAAGESVERPLHYYEQNVTGTQRLLAAMVETGVRRMLFSSSAATYGTPDTDVVTEESPTVPESPYGESKLVSEWLIKDVARAHGMDWISLRYFNVAGAGAPELGDVGVHNLVPLALQALSNGEAPRVFGDDYPTRDGSCIRDYIHVVDLAEAHAAAAARLEDGAGSDGSAFGEIYNVGRGEGITVKEVLAAVRRITGHDVEPVVVGRRAGDPSQIVASAEKIERDLGWTARFDLDDMVRSAWEAWAARRPAGPVPAR